MVPGVILIEALAQISGLICAGDDAAKSNVPQAEVADRDMDMMTLAHVDVKLKRPVIPPAEIGLESRSVRAMGSLHQLDVLAKVESKTVAVGQLVLARSAPEAE